MAHSTRRMRRGFSLVELVITLFLVSIIGLAASRMLMNQTRFYARLAGQRDARSVTREARSLLQTELSMVEAGGGAVAAASDSITVRVPYAWGVRCTAGTMLRLSVDSAMYAMATPSGYASKDTSATGPYTYTPVSSAVGGGSASDCTGLGLTAPPGGSYLSLSPTTVGTAGAPMFLYETITYRFATSAVMPGRRGLYRRVGTAAAEEILAPFGATAGFRYYRLTADTAQNMVPAAAEIRGVEVAFDAESVGRASSQIAPESVSIRTAFFFRNRTDP